MVEARERSGSLVTARHAADQGVEVFAVPGPIDARRVRGTNRLLRDGARAAARSAADVLDALGWPAPRRAASAAAPRRVGSARRGILRRAALARSASGDELARRLGARARGAGAGAARARARRAASREDRDGRWRALVVSGKRL